MPQPPVELKVLTFNLWGIFNSKMREDRMAHFASKVEHYDIILLQEQFDPDDFTRMQSLVPEHVRKTRYFRRFPSGFYGSGCAVISRFPITSAFFHIYPLQGYPEMVLHGDFFANKGVALVKVAVPMERNGAMVNQELILYTTHLVAVYQKVSQMSTWKKERYLPYRISQAISLADFVMNTSKPTDYIIIGGDFNSSQRSLEVQMMLILLKRKGYDLRSVLPTPGNLLEQAHTEEQAEQARSMFTYSYRNAFNASKTSYFKLLKLEADIPAQIDHIFFNSAAFTLKSFEDCPDASPTFPFTIDAEGNGSKVPTGVVVFTKNEVLRTQAPSRLARWADALRRRGQNNPQSPLTRLANVLAAPGKDTSPTPSAGGAAAATTAAGGRSASPPFAADDALSRFPISDHFGVACRLQLRSQPGSALESNSPSEDENWHHVTPSTGSIAAAVAPGVAAVPLTEEELLVVRSVQKFLGGFVRKLRHQVKVTRVMAAISISTVVLNLWFLRRAASAQEQRTALTLKQLYHMATDAAWGGGAGARRHGSAGLPAEEDAHAAANSSSALDPAKLQTTAKRLLSKTKEWAGGTLDAVGIHIKETPTATLSEGRQGHFPSSSSSSTAVVGGATGAPAVPDFFLLAKELSLRSVWTSLGLFTFVTAVGSVFSIGSFAVGMFQRAGNANILAEQVRLISPDTLRTEEEEEEA